MRTFWSSFWWYLSFFCAGLVMLSSISNIVVMTWPIQLISGMILVCYLIWVQEKMIEFESKSNIQQDANIERNKLHKQCRKAHDELRRWIDSHEGNRVNTWSKAPIEPFQKSLYILIDKFPVERRLPEVIVWMGFDRWLTTEVSPLDSSRQRDQ